VHQCRAQFTSVLPQKTAAKAPKTNDLRVSRHMLPVQQLSCGFCLFLSSTEADCGMDSVSIRSAIWQ